MITLDIQNGDFRRACARAWIFHNHVARAGEYVYRVRSGHTGGHYTVRFHHGRHNEKLAGCTCHAGQRDTLCHHIASALGVHIAIRQMQRTAQQPGYAA